MNTPDSKFPSSETRRHHCIPKFFAPVRTRVRYYEYSIHLTYENYHHPHIQYMKCKLSLQKTNQSTKPNLVKFPQTMFPNDSNRLALPKHISISTLTSAPQKNNYTTLSSIKNWHIRRHSSLLGICLPKQHFLNFVERSVDTSKFLHETQLLSE